MADHQVLGAVAVVGAMREEVARLHDALEDPREVHRGPVTLHAGRLEGVDVLLAQCGIGKVNAAVTAQTLLLEGAKRLVFTGVAGALAPELRVGDVVVSTDAVQHDVDVGPLGYEPGEVPGSGLAWEADAALREAATAAAEDLADVRVVAGRIASGDRFVADPEVAADLHLRFGAACAEMEGAAVAQVCARWAVPFVIVRSISDTADHAAGVDFRAFTELAASRAERVVRGLLRRLAH
ncbi:MAG: 5'-methylthioadenosine/adenosylhomocysteine nucleosidase [Trueperaceae bacterium]